MAPEIERVESHPLKELSDEKLKIFFSNQYAEIHVNGTINGNEREVLSARAALYAMQEELVERGINPADVIGPKVI